MMNAKTVDPKQAIPMDAISECLGDLRQLESRITTLGDGFKAGSQAGRGLTLVQRNLENARHNLERLRMVAKAETR